MIKQFDLRQKKVIDVDSAEKIGCIRDMDIDFKTGKINSVTIPQKGIRGLFGSGKKITVSWENVIAIGSEFILIKQK